MVLDTTTHLRVLLTHDIKHGIPSSHQVDKWCQNPQSPPPLLRIVKLPAKRDSGTMRVQWHNYRYTNTEQLTSSVAKCNPYHLSVIWEKINTYWVTLSWQHCLLPRVVVNLFIFDEGFNFQKAFHDLQFSRNEYVSSATW